MVKILDMRGKQKKIEILAVLLVLSSIAYGQGELNLNSRVYGRNEKDLDYGPGNKKTRYELNGWSDTLENQSVKFRLREYRGDEDEWRDGHDTKIEYFFHHGGIGETKIKHSTDVEYRDYFNNKAYIISEKFNFARYYPKYFDWLLLSPFYSYMVYEDSSASYQSDVGLSLEYGKAFETWDYSGRTVVARQFFSDNAKPNRAGYPEEEYGENTVVYMEFYLTKIFYKYIFENGKDSISLKTEFGLDPYEYNSKPFRWNSTYTHQSERAVYSTYILPYVEYEKFLAKDLSLILSVGAEYRNWRRIEYDNVADWSWQAQALAGIKYRW
ncbi:MAG: hypothetical protein ACRC7W_00035 [Fusobacteriaceae bacterium]